MKHTYYKEANEHVYTFKLKNGMRVHLLPKDEPSYLTYAEVSIPFGNFALKFQTDQGLYELPAGTAHFLEHKIFAMPDGNDGFQMFTQLGTDANAMTGYSQTSYLFSATDNVDKALIHMLNMLDTTHFTEENVNSERLIIGEEIKMYLDDPQTEMMNHLTNNMYENHPIKEDIGGTLESIKEITPQTLSDAHRYFYQPSNRLLVMSGKIDVKHIYKVLKAYDHDVVKEKVKTIYSKEPNRILIKHEVIEKPIHIPKIMIGVKLVPKKRNPINSIKIELAFSYLMGMLFGNSSKLTETLMREGLINQNYYYAPIFEEHAESLLLYAETKKPFLLKRIIIDALVNGSDDINEENFERFKKVSLGQHVFALNSIEFKAHLYGKYIHQKANLFEAIDTMRELTFEDILEAKAHIKKNRISTLIYKKAKS